MRPAITVACLTYKDPAWLSFFLAGLFCFKNKTPYRVMVVGNDADADVVATGRLDIDHHNGDGHLPRIGRIYNAWNLAVRSAETDWIVLANDDMFTSDYWLDELIDLKLAEPMSIPCSLLVESGRIPSAMPEYVKNFGLTPEEFDGHGWRKHADSIRRPGASEPGRLFMPCLLERAAFLRVGGYPLSNPGGVSGDRVLFSRLAELGYRHVTALGSVVYHVQCGAAGGYYGPE